MLTEAPVGSHEHACRVPVLTEAPVGPHEQAYRVPGHARPSLRLHSVPASAVCPILDITTTAADTSMDTPWTERTEGPRILPGSRSCSHLNLLRHFQPCQWRRLDSNHRLLLKVVHSTDVLVCHIGQCRDRSQEKWSLVKMQSPLALACQIPPKSETNTFSFSRLGITKTHNVFFG